MQQSPSPTHEQLSYLESKWFEYSKQQLLETQKQQIRELCIQYGTQEVIDTLEIIKYKHFITKTREGIAITEEMAKNALTKLSQALFVRNKNPEENKPSSYREKEEHHAIKENDCYGEKKLNVVQNYYLNPIAYLKLIEGQKKIGCCGELKDRFVIFDYTHKSSKERGVFFVGYDCAKQIIDLVNQKKAELSKPLIELPPLFDPSGKKGFISPLPSMLPINCDILEVVLMLASLWDIQDFKGKLPYLLSTIWRNPFLHPEKEDMLALNRIVGKDFYIMDNQCETLTERIKLESKQLYCPPLPSLKAVLSFMLHGKMVQKSHI